ncbi:hypothetical protein [Vibrio metschnikovii]|uniref:hypothetical protein n=1 Tax=Vibrio metschnikovii TaxID=28172 RepID=UPI001C303BB6|nr:hypothetical protein [Vibrio metschnikovii]
MNKLCFKISNECIENYYEVEKIKPFNLGEFCCETVTLEFTGTCSNFQNGENKSTSTFYHEINHNLNLNTYNLVDSGWLPPAYCLEEIYILDRNVVSGFESSHTRNYQEMNSWFSIMRDSNSIRMSSIFSAIEKRGGFSDYDGFKMAMEIDQNDILKVLPKFKALRFNESQLRGIYKFICSFRTAENISFLMEATNLIYKSVPKKLRMLISMEVIELARKYKINGTVHLVVLCISCIFSGEKNNQKFARKIIKPKVNYTEKMALNCINDVLFIDIILLLKKIVDPCVSGTTCDRALAMYWCALAPAIRYDSENFVYDINLGSELFPLASEKELEQISRAINEL